MKVSHAPSILVAPAGGDLTVPAIAALKQTASFVDLGFEESGEPTAFADALQYAKYAQTLITGDAVAENNTLLPMLESTVIPGLERLVTPGDMDSEAFAHEASIVKSAALNVADALSLLVAPRR